MNLLVLTRYAYFQGVTYNPVLPCPKHQGDTGWMTNSSPPLSLFKCHTSEVAHLQTPVYPLKSFGTHWWSQVTSAKCDTQTRDETCNVFSVWKVNAMIAFIEKMSVYSHKCGRLLIIVHQYRQWYAEFDITPKEHLKSPFCLPRRVSGRGYKNGLVSVSVCLSALS